MGKSKIYVRESDAPIYKVKDEFYPFLGVQERDAVTDWLEEPINRGVLIKGLYYENGRFASKVPPIKTELRGAYYWNKKLFTEPEDVNRWLASGCATNLWVG